MRALVDVCVLSSVRCIIRATLCVGVQGAEQCCEREYSAAIVSVSVRHRIPPTYCTVCSLTLRNGGMKDGRMKDGGMKARRDERWIDERRKWRATSQI